MFVSVYMYAHVCVGAHRKQMRVLDPWEQELQVVVDWFDFGAGNQTKVFRKSRKYFYTPNHLSGFTIWIFGWNFLPSASSKFPLLLLVLFVSFQKLPQMSGNPWWLIIIMRVYLDNQQLWPCGWGMDWLGLYFTMISMVSHLLWQFPNVSMFVLCPLG